MFRLGLGLDLGSRHKPGGSTPPTIESFFGNGEAGAWYDHTDITTMWLTSAGKNHLTVAGEPVGVRLDRKSGAATSSNIVTGYDPGFFASGSTAEVLTNTPTGYLTTQWFPVTAGEWYHLEPTGGTATRRRVQTKDSVGTISWQAAISFEGTPIDAIIQAPVGATQMRIYFKQNTETATGMLVRHIPGRMGLQTTLGARPLYQTGPSRLVFDGINDALVTTFPISLGSSVTIGRAIPGTGSQILTAQTVGTSFSDTVTSSAVVLVNRALTSQEAAVLAAYLNSKAGV